MAMRRALDAYIIRGVVCNINFVRDVMDNSKFLSGDVTTNFIPSEYPNPPGCVPCLLTCRSSPNRRLLAFFNRDMLVQIGRDKEREPAEACLGAAACAPNNHTRKNSLDTNIHDACHVSLQVAAAASDLLSRNACCTWIVTEI